MFNVWCICMKSASLSINSNKHITWFILINTYIYKIWVYDQSSITFIFVFASTWCTLRAHTFCKKKSRLAVGKAWLPHWSCILSLDFGLAEMLLVLVLVLVLVLLIQFCSWSWPCSFQILLYLFITFKNGNNGMKIIKF